MPLPPSSVVETVERLTIAGLMSLPAVAQRLIAGRPIRMDGETLDVETQMALRIKELIRDPAVESLPIPEGRQQMRRETAVVGGHQHIGSVRDLEVEGGAGPIPARLFVPSEDSDALLVFFHGGGWVYGDLDTHEPACRSLAERAGVRVLSVDYRLAPEAPFPAPYDDATSAFRWAVAHLDELGAVPERVAVGGDSAGGALAAATALMAAREGLPLAFQLLIYPATDLTNGSETHARFGNGFYLTTEYKDRTRAAHLPNEADWTDPRASVLYDDVPDGLAPAYLCTAGFDPLRDEGEAYARKLADAGVEVELQRFPTLIHGFFNIAGIGTSSRNAHLEIVGKLREAMAR